MRKEQTCTSIFLRGYTIKPKILYYHPAHISDYMRPTKRLIKHVIKYHSSRFDIIDCITRTDSNDMGKWLGRFWNTGSDIFIIGCDNVPEITTMYEMLQCDSELCVNPCISFPPSTALDRPMLNQIDGKGRMYEAHERPEMIHYAGTGFCKIGTKAQRDCHIHDFEFGFPMFDSTIKDLGLVNWHAHYPIHRHTKDEERYSHLRKKVKINHEDAIKNSPEIGGDPVF